MFKEIVIPKTLVDLVKIRNEALGCYQQSRILIERANDLIKESIHYGVPGSAQVNDREENVVKELDRALWRDSFDKTGFMQIMDSDAVTSFERSLRDNPPEFTIENIRSIFASQFQDADMMFKRGVFNVFRRLTRTHKTNSNDTFKINKKCIVSGAFNRGWSGGLMVNNYFKESLNDLDRVIKVLDGKKHNPRELEMKLNDAFQKESIFEDEYYRIKGFKNTNGHIEFKREDLLEKVNDIISEHLGGNAIGKKEKAA